MNCAYWFTPGLRLTGICLVVYWEIGASLYWDPYNNLDFFKNFSPLKGYFDSMQIHDLTVSNCA